MTTLDLLARSAIDLAAMVVLTLVLFLPRHGRRDLVTVFALFNAGLLAVLLVIDSGALGVGAGLGLFGVLSIVRLRSEQYRNVEIGYFFISLAVALVCALAPGLVRPAVLCAAILVVAAVADAQRLLAGSRQMEVVLDQVVAQADLLGELRHRLGPGVEDVSTVEVDYVRLSMRLQVRMRTVARTGFASRPA